MTKRTAKQKALDGAIRQGMGDGLDRFELFFNTYQKQIFYGAGIAVLVIAAIAGIVSYNISANRAAAEAFGSAKSEDQLVAALEKYGDNDLSYFARQRLARLYAADQKFDLAVEVLQPVTTASSPEVAGRGRLLQAYFQEESGKLPEAMASFALVAENPALPTELQAEAGYGAGRLARKLGKNSEALSYLNRTVELGKNTATASEWGRQAAFLAASLPAAK